MQAIDKVSIKDISLREFIQLSLIDFGRNNISEGGDVKGFESSLERTYDVLKGFENDLEKASDVLSAALLNSDDDWEVLTRKDNKRRFVALKMRGEECDVSIFRFKRLIQEVNDWVAPTPDHEEFKIFMLKELMRALKDCVCDKEEVVYNIENYKDVSCEDFKINYIKSCEDLISELTVKCDEARETFLKNHLWRSQISATIRNLRWDRE